jgi:hypothetical protein
VQVGTDHRQPTLSAEQQFTPWRYRGGDVNVAGDLQAVPGVQVVYRPGAAIDHGDAVGHAEPEVAVGIGQCGIDFVAGQTLRGADGTEAVGSIR